MRFTGRIRVAVIIPTYRRRDSLLMAVRSVLNQSFGELECHVVDDASGDDSLSVLEEVDDDRLRVHRLESNRGPAAARNYGVCHSVSEVVAFLDSDDRWLPTKLESVFSAMEGVERSSRWVCAHPYARGGERSGKGVQRLETIGDIGEHLFYELRTFQTSTWVVSRACFEAQQFNPDWSRHEDWDLLLQWQHSGVRFFYVDQPLTVRSFGSADRLGFSRDSEVSRHFLEHHSPGLGARARAGFRGHILAAKHWLAGERRKALRVGLGCWREEGLGWREGLHLFFHMARANGRRVCSRIRFPN